MYNMYRVGGRRRSVRQLFFGCWLQVGDGDSKSAAYTLTPFRPGFALYEPKYFFFLQALTLSYTLTPFRPGFALYEPKYIFFLQALTLSYTLTPFTLKILKGGKMISFFPLKTREKKKKKRLSARESEIWPSKGVRVYWLQVGGGDSKSTAYTLTPFTLKILKGERWISFFPKSREKKKKKKIIRTGKWDLAFQGCKGVLTPSGGWWLQVLSLHPYTLHSQNLEGGKMIFFFPLKTREKTKKKRLSARESEIWPSKGVRVYW
jgi:hypothetical protein